MEKTRTVDDASWLESAKVLDGDTTVSEKTACVEDLVSAWKKSTRGTADIEFNDIYVVSQPRAATPVGLAQFRTSEELTTNQILTRIRERGFEPATFEDLLACGDPDTHAAPGMRLVALGTRITKIIPGGGIGYPSVQRDRGTVKLQVSWKEAGDTWPQFNTVFLFRHPGKS